NDCGCSERGEFAAHACRHATSGDQGLQPRVVGMTGKLETPTVQVDQVTDEAQAEGDAVRQQVHARLALPSVLRRLPGTSQQIAGVVSGVDRVSPPPATAKLYTRGKAPADDGTKDERPPDDGHAFLVPVEGADPGAEAHLHLDVPGAHATNRINREQQH